MSQRRGFGKKEVVKNWRFSFSGSSIRVSVLSFEQIKIIVYANTSYWWCRFFGEPFV
jgi:hypothetical protein